MPLKMLKTIILIPILLVIVLFVAPTFSMDFSWDPSPQVKARLRLTGEIQTGDSDKFLTFIRADFDDYLRSSRYVYVSSNGGNLVEAIKLASILKSLYPNVVVPVGAKCASACFFLYLAGVERLVFEEGSLGIHRAYFDPSYFSGLTLAEAKRQQTQLAKAIKGLLEENSVSASLIDRMNRTSSSDIYWLSIEEVQSLGINPPWYEEMLIAKCGFDASLTQKRRAAPMDSPEFRALDSAWEANLEKTIQCEETFIITEIEKVKTSLGIKSRKQIKPPRKS